MAFFRFLAYHRKVSDRSAHNRRSPASEPSEMRVRFAQLVSRPDPLIDLGAAWACISTEAEQLADPGALVAELDALAERVRARLDPSLQLAARPDSAIRTSGQLDTIVDALHDVLYGDLGLRAAPRDVWEPGHTYLDGVLRRRRGLPIALGLIELEVGWRVGLPLYGIGLPGHFIVGGPGGLLLDPYGGGRRLSPADCRVLVLEATGRPLSIDRSVLRPATHREILARLLGNLRGIFLARREWASALWVVEYLIVLDPADPGLRRDRALLFGRVGRFTDAVAGLERYLEEAPDADDREEVTLARAIFGGRRN
jgi:regulator of sirC expression with transglutaminase-like and TPR domain